LASAPILCGSYHQITTVIQVKNNPPISTGPLTSDNYNSKKLK
jgi:hypothetical protein